MPHEVGMFWFSIKRQTWSYRKEMGEGQRYLKRNAWQRYRWEYTMQDQITTYGLSGLAYGVYKGCNKNV